MELNIWTKRHFNENSKIEWQCPNCNHQSLEIVKDDLKQKETFASKKMRASNDYWEVEWIELIFTGRLLCKNCEDSVFFVGKGNPDHYESYDYETGEYYEESIIYFTPTFFQPAIKIFQIPSECPDLVKSEIEDSFKLFWCDLSSCANKLRMSLEVLLTEQKVKRYETVSGRRRSISLHRRIQLFENQEVRELLLAIKWIGNTGSHVGKLETIDILETYKLLEFALKKLFDNEESEIKKITKEINKRKGTRKRKK